MIKDLLAGLIAAGSLLTTFLTFSLPALAAGDETGSLERYHEVLERPLFSPTRRPTPGAVVPKADDAGGLPVLQGIVVAPKQKFALFAVGAEAATRRAGEGETIAHWTIKKIAANRVTLAAEDGTPLELTLTERREENTRQ